MATPVDPEDVVESVLLTRPGRPGDVVRKVGRVHTDDGDVVALLEGTVRRERTLAGEEVMVEGIDRATALVDRADLPALREGLDRLANRLDGESGGRRSPPI